MHTYFEIDLEKLAKIQLSRRMTMNDLAKETGLARHTIDNLYRGRTKNRVRTLIAIAKALDVDPNEIVKGGFSIE